MTILVDDKAELSEYNKSLAPIFAKWLHAYLECSDVSQEVVTNMAKIISDPEADDDDKDMARATLIEALFPSTHNGALGADLEELESLHCEHNSDFAAISAEMDKQEETFGERVKCIMRDKGITQEDLAASTGVNQSAISMLLNRRARPQKRTVAKIAEALDVDVATLWQ